MKRDENSSIRNGLIITVVGGLILAGITYLGKNYLQILEWLKITVEKIRQYFMATSNLPNSIVWLFGLVILALLTSFVIYIVRYRNIGNSPVANKPNQEIQKLQREINTLKAQTAPDLTNLAGLDDKITLSGHYYGYELHTRKVTRVSLTWREIFSLIAQFLLQHPNETLVRKQYSLKQYSKVIPSIPRLTLKIMKQSKFTLWL